MSGPARLIHCDWSADPRRRWMSVARRDGGGWRLDAPAPVPADPTTLAAEGPVFIGVDFPIGLPIAYAETTGRADFRDFLAGLDAPGWADFARPAASPAEIGPRRPFYPARPGAAKKAHLVEGLGLTDAAALKRRADRLCGACETFWTMGPQQVGKAALAGWASLARPLAPRAALWPFDGDLGPLLAGGATVLAETYPGDGYRQIGLDLSRRWSKRRREDRAAHAPRLLAAAEAASVALSPDARDAAREGYGAEAAAEDRFDSAVGAIAMARVLALGVETAPVDAAVRRWEGWMLGLDRG